MFVSPQIQMLNPNPHGNSIRRWRLPEVIRLLEKSLMNEISTLIKEDSESFLALSTMGSYNPEGVHHLTVVAP